MHGVEPLVCIYVDMVSGRLSLLSDLLGAVLGFAVMSILTLIHFE